MGNFKQYIPQFSSSDTDSKDYTDNKVLEKFYIRETKEKIENVANLLWFAGAYLKEYPVNKVLLILVFCGFVELLVDFSDFV